MGFQILGRRRAIFYYHECLNVSSHVRSPSTGIYANLQKYNLPYPEAIFELDYFRQNPRPFNTWAKEFFPGENYLPNTAHYFLKVLQDKEKLSKYFTQNIDGLEKLAGS